MSASSFSSSEQAYRETGAPGGPHSICFAHSPAHYLYAPDFIDLELYHILCKRIRRSELTVEEAEEIREIMLMFPIQKYPFAPLRDRAFATASITSRGIYDCLYLTLARLLDVRMVTAEERFHDALRGGPWEQHLCWVGDLPAVGEE